MSSSRRSTRILAEKRRVADDVHAGARGRPGDHDAGRAAVGDERLLDVRDPRRGRVRADARRARWPRSRERGVESRTFFCPMNLQPFLRDQPGFRDVAVPGRRGALAARPLPTLVARRSRDEEVADDRRAARRALRRPLVNSYTGLHARVYDEIYADKPYAEEARFVARARGRARRQAARRRVRHRAGTRSPSPTSATRSRRRHQRGAARRRARRGAATGFGSCRGT